MTKVRKQLDETRQALLKVVKTIEGVYGSESDNENTEDEEEVQALESCAADLEEVCENIDEITDACYFS